MQVYSKRLTDMTKFIDTCNSEVNCLTPIDISNQPAEL